MNDDLAIICCDKCQTRLRVKPGLLKVMKTIKCSKCGHPIPVSNIVPPTPAPPPPETVITPAPEKPALPIQPLPAKVEKPVEPVSLPVAAIPDLSKNVEIESLQNKLRTAELDLESTRSTLRAADQELESMRSTLRAADQELESMRAKFRSTEQELAESDARISDLQEQWHSKEIEIREMADRLQKAEEECKQALALRDDFLARAKNELAIYLMGERDSALNRFSELEKRLMTLHPGIKTR